MPTVAAVEALYGSHVATLTIPTGSATADHTGFPVYADLSDMPASFWSAVDNGGGSIRVFKEAGSDLIECAREVVSCDTATDTGELHFKTDLLTLSDNVYRIYADGTSYAVTDTFGRNAVWADYALVSHMRSEALAVVDATGNSANATITGTLASTTINGFSGLSFDGTQRIEFPDTPEHDGFGNSTTVQSLIRSESTDNSQIVVSKRQSWSTSGDLLPWELSIDLSGVNLSARYGGNTTPGTRFSSALTIGADTFVSSTGVSGALEFYVNNNSPVSRTDTTFDTIGNSAAGATIGSLPGGGEQFKGSLAEVRINKTALSSAWITDEYNNQSDPASFYSIAANEPATSVIKINLGTSAIDKLYFGSTEITKAYLGATEVYNVS